MHHYNGYCQDRGAAQWLVGHGEYQLLSYLSSLTITGDIYGETLKNHCQSHNFFLQRLDLNDETYKGNEC